MNKKILAILMALLLIVVGSIAMAEETLEITKQYDSGNGIYPKETLSFTATLDSYTDATGKTGTKNTSGVSELKAEATAEGDGANLKPTFTLPDASEYPEAGIYTYTVTETKGTVAGVEYDESTFKFQVLVTYEYDEDVAKQVIEDVQFQTKDSEGNKVGGFLNTVTVNGGDDEDENSTTLHVTKTITGNSAVLTDEFDVTLTVTVAENLTIDTSMISVTGDTAATINGDDNVATIAFKVTNGSDYAIKGLPIGATVTAKEDDKATDAGYKVTYSLEEAKVGTDTLIAITNTRETSIETGVNTDVLPYVVLMAIVAMGAVAFVMKKRIVRE